VIDWMVVTLIFVSGLIAGFAFQRSRLCFVSGLRDLFLFGETGMTRAILVLLTAAAAVGPWVVRWRQGFGLTVPFTLGPPLLESLLGGGLFGAGMVLAGSCAAGAFWRLGEGQGSQLWVLGGMLAGIWGHAILPAGSGAATRLALPLWAAPVALVIVLAGLVVWERERQRHQDGEELMPALKGRSLHRPWAPETGALVIALSLVAFIATTGTTWRLIRPFLFDDVAGALFALGLIGGGHAAARFGREWRPRPAGSWRQRFIRLAGGLLMGYGGRLGWGCTIGALLSGAAVGSAQAWIWLAGAAAGAWLGTRLLRRLLST